MKERRTIGVWGRRGDRVRVLVDRKRDRIEVLYRDLAGISHKRVFPRTEAGQGEALAWGETYHTERKRRAEAALTPAPIAMRELWLQYQRGLAWANHRPATQVNYAERWRLIERYFGRDRAAHEIQLADIERFIADARQTRAINQVRQVVNVARIIFRWGRTRRLVATEEFSLFKWTTPKDALVHAPEEYSADEYLRLLTHADPQSATWWRLNVVLLLAGASGQRARAILNLRWADVDPVAGLIKWPKLFQKQGKELTRPLTWDMVAALETARYWRTAAAAGRVRADRLPASSAERLQDSDWVVFAMHRKASALSYQSLHSRLRKAEGAAGVTHRAFRALHGLRRKVVGDVGVRTGDRMLGLEYVGDTDPKMLKHYDKRGDERVAKAAESMEGER